MAFGFPAYHEEDIPIPDGMPPHAIPQVFQRIAWAGSPNHDGRSWKAATAMNLASYGEEISIVWIAQNMLRVRSQCAMPTQCLDWGRNAKNVRTFKGALYEHVQTWAGPYR
jgi:hypothetical protein